MILRIISFLIVVTHAFVGRAQISFKVDPKYENKFARADSAIKANEFGTVHSLLIIQNGSLLFEEYYNGWRPDSVHQLQSATKSVVATLLGCALQQDFVKSVEDRIGEYYPPNYFTDSLHGGIKLKDLLTQRHGLKWKEEPWDSPDNTWRKILSTTGDWYKLIMQTEFESKPGFTFNYSNAAPVLTSGVIQQASKMNIDKFAMTYLFGPLEIEQYWFWPGNGGPQNNGLALLSLTSRDMAKIGQLYLQKGMWKNQQIIPSFFVEEATSSIVGKLAPNGFYESYDYGYFWWSNPKFRAETKQSTDRIFMARGAGGQNIIVYPAENLVVVITAWNMQQPNKPQAIFDKYIKP